MRIAFTGTSSTGKTTLINELFKRDDFTKFDIEFSTTDARGILDSMGFKQMDHMTQEQTKEFQMIYVETKKRLESLILGNYIVDRSFVDTASYWLIRECQNNISAASHFIEEAENLSKRYDLHFYFPYGIIPFQPDGYRSNNESQREQIDQQIKRFLNEWGIKYVELSTNDLNERVNIVIEELNLLYK